MWTLRELEDELTDDPLGGGGDLSNQPDNDPDN